MAGYEKILGKQTYFGGEEISLADLAHIPYGNMLAPQGVKFLEDEVKFPNVARYVTSSSMICSDRLTESRSIQLDGGRTSLLVLRGRRLHPHCRCTYAMIHVITITCTRDKTAIALLDDDMHDLQLRSWLHPMRTTLSCIIIPSLHAIYLSSDMQPHFWASSIHT
jgi:hypothetical protein